MLNKGAGQSRARAETDQGKTIRDRMQPCTVMYMRQDITGVVGYPT